MSSCFTVDTSVDFANEGVSYYYYYARNAIGFKARAHKAIIAGSGAYQNSTMHSGIGNVNYVSYRVRRIKFEADYTYNNYVPANRSRPDYAVLFKVPYREPIISDTFTSLNDFILYKEPEKVLGFDVFRLMLLQYQQEAGGHFNIDVTKPFIVGPNDYVGVFYFLSVEDPHKEVIRVSGSATVWFDPV